MQQSNGYIITFSIILTVVLGLLLSGTSQVLGPIQKKAEDLDNKKQILGAVMSPSDLKALSPEEVLKYYESRIASKVVDIEGKEIQNDSEGNTIVAETVNVGKNYKKSPSDRLYPIFIYHEEGNKEAAISYVLPVYGAGLWDEIWGYVALKTDLNTIEGVTFSHKGETPGLGARITENGVQARYQGKKIFDENGELQAVIMQKGEGRDYNSEKHKVDGLSGATITANGVNDMLRNYIGHYKPYLEKRKSGSSTELAVLN